MPLTATPNADDTYAAFLDRTERFVELCESMDVGTGTTHWTFVSQEIVVNDSFDFSMRQVYRLNSDVLLGSTFTKEEKAFIPVIPVDQRFASANAVSIVSVGGERSTRPVAFQSINHAVERRAITSDSWDKWLAVPMSIAEYSSAPIVGVEANLRAGRTLVSPTSSIIQLMPVSSLDLRLANGVPLTRLSISWPEYATVDVVAVHCSLNLHSFVTDLDEALDLYDDQARRSTDRALAGVAKSLFGIVDGDPFTNVQRLLRDIQSNVVKQFTSTFGRSPSSVELSQWLGGVETACAAATTWGELDGDTLTASASRAAVVALRDSLCKDISFFSPAVASADGTVELTLRKDLRDRSKFVTVRSVLSAFTSEQEPSTQGKRSAVLLFLLGGLLIALSLMDLSWLPDRAGNLSEHRALASLSNLDRAGSLRETLVALLLLFPAALYGQFFQLRPTSPSGHQAQAGTFGALSLLFALPMAPAAYLAAGGTLATASAMVAMLGLLTLGMGAWVWFTFRDRRLAKLRQRELMRCVSNSHEASNERRAG